MSWAGAVLSVVRNHDAYILLGLASLVLILLLLVTSLHVKVGRLSRRKPSIQGGLDPQALESLEQGLVETRGNSQKISALRDSHEALANRQNFCVQKVSLVRFNAFQDVGGEQSFALALLDAKDNGVILSSLLSRTESRTYSKAVTAGKSEQVLSQEEQEALSRAIRM